MEVEHLPENFELSRPEQAIVDILNHYYLEELKFIPGERPILKKLRIRFAGEILGKPEWQIIIFKLDSP